MGECLIKTAFFLKRNNMQQQCSGMQCGKFFQMRSTHAAEFFFHSQASCNNFLSHQIEKETIRITTCSVANTQIHT